MIQPVSIWYSWDCNRVREWYQGKNRIYMHSIGISDFSADTDLIRITIRTWSFLKIGVPYVFQRKGFTSLFVWNPPIHVGIPRMTHSILRTGQFCRTIRFTRDTLECIYSRTRHCAAGRVHFSPREEKKVVMLMIEQNEESIDREIKRLLARIVEWMVTGVGGEQYNPTSIFPFPVALARDCSFIQSSITCFSSGSMTRHIYAW